MNYAKYILGVALICSMVTGVFGAAPKGVEAQAVFVPTYDSLNHTTAIGNLTQNTISAQALFKLDLKENVFDGILVAIGKQVISTITQSIVTWINSGFEGGPAFVTDPNAFFTDLADQVTGQFIDRLGAGFLCQSFHIPLKLALTLDFNHGNQGTYLERYACTASGIAENFSSGNIVSLDTFFDVAVTTSNNPYGSFLAAKQQLSLNILGKQINQSKLLDWGRGFLSKKECDENGENCKITTPGAIVEDQLANVMGSGIRQLELADEINEIIGALANQLISTVIEAGVSGLSNNDSSGSRPIDRFVNNSEVAATRTQDSLLAGGPTRFCRGTINLDGDCVGDEIVVDADEQFQNTQEEVDVDGVNVGDISAQFGNLARDGVVSQRDQSGTIDGVVQGPRFAVDGRTSGEYSRTNNFSIVTSQNNQYAWWEVDLGKEVLIDEITIFRQKTEPQGGNVLDIDFDRALGDTEVVFYNSSQEEIIGERISVVAPQGTDDSSVKMSANIAARYVRIARRSAGDLRLAEVLVNGRDLNGVASRNLALRNGTPRQSSDAHPWDIASKATNGDKIGIRDRDNSFIRPARTDLEKSPWWEIEFREELIFDEILIYQGGSSISNRSGIGRINVTVWEYDYNANATPVWSSGFITVPTDGPRPFTLDIKGSFFGGARGRTVRIQRENAAGITTLLNLAEVEIYGRALGN